jgi:hypothetical protein
MGVMFPLGLEGTMKVYNGRDHVGDIEDSGCLQENMRLSTALLKELGLHERPSESKAIYLQAKAFASTAIEKKTRCLTYPPYKPEGAAPFIVNAAFACELYLKSIQCIFGGYEEGHSLNVLFKHLPNKVKDYINKLSKNMASEFQVEEGVLFKEHLKKVSGAFTKYRYIFEQEEESFNTAHVLFPLKVLELTAIKYVKEHNQFSQKNAASSASA